MKVRVVRDWHTKARTVRVTLTGRETLNYALAERLKHTDLPFLPPFKYQIKGDSAVLFYDITGCMKICRAVPGYYPIRGRHHRYMY